MVEAEKFTKETFYLHEEKASAGIAVNTLIFNSFL
jgi:hypothetical protein